MSRKITANFSVSSWDETPFIDQQGENKMTTTRAGFIYTGDINGQSSIALVMIYDQQGQARYTGIEILEGNVLGRTGKIALRHEGHFDGKTSRTSLHIIPEYCHGELRGLSGSGHSEATHGGEFHLELTIDLPVE